MTGPADTAVAAACPVCGAPIEIGDSFCEACGAPLTAGAAGSPAGGTGAGAVVGAAAPGAAGASGAAGAGGGAGASGGAPVAGPGSPTGSSPTAPAGPVGRTNPCVGCGAPPGDIGTDGYCTICGRLQPGPREHLEVDLAWAAGVTDRGLHHPHNEDAFHLELAGPEADRGIVAVVCDGVSSSVHAEEAAESASAAAATVLAAVVAGPGSLADATVHAADAATRAVAALPWTAAGSLASPSCTLVSAACRAGDVAVGWVGDSRAYWIGVDGGMRQLTVDDSWAEAEIESGRMTEVEADADPRSHAITRWVGADAPDIDAQVATMVAEPGGRLLLCSDGLWNYAPTVSDMTELLARQPDGATPIELARCLTEFARNAGGHDNITVVVIDFPGTPANEKGSP